MMSTPPPPPAPHEEAPWQPPIIKVVIVDDHAITRDGLRVNAEKSPIIEVVGEGSAGEHLEPLIRKYRPDVVLLDLQMPQHAGDNIRSGAPLFQPLSAIRSIRQRYPATQFIIVSQHLPRGILEQLVDAGVSGYLLKEDTMSTELVSAIRTVHNGGICLSREVSDLLTNRPRGVPQPEYITERQKEVVIALLTNPDASASEIANRLGIAHSTLRNHIRELRQRLGVRTTKAALLKAVQLGLVSADLITTRDLYGDTN